MTPERELAALEAVLQTPRGRELWETMRGADAVLDFVPQVSPRWMRPTHLRPVAGLLARAAFERVRALVSAPPRHSKTETIAHGIVWWLKRHPDKTAAYVAYGADVAENKSRIMRDIAERSGLELRKDARHLSEWRLPQGGGLLAVGIDGPLTSKGVDLLVVDDPYKSRAEADSLTERAHINEWLTGTAMTRLEPGASVIITHARWHIADIIGVLAELPGSQWEYINLPAIDDSGAALWPERWPLSELLLRKDEIVEAGGIADWESLYLGRPRIKGEQIFGNPARYERPDVLGARILIACDPATGAGDNSAIVVLAGKRDQDGKLRVDVLDVRAMRIEIPQLVTELVAMQRQWQAPVIVEAVGGFKGVGQAMRTISNITVTDVPAIRSKYIRAQPLAAAWAGGQVRFPLPTAPTFGPWVGPCITECNRFTGNNDPQDDRVDALAHGFNQMVQEVGRNADDRTRRLAAAHFGA